MFELAQNGDIPPEANQTAGQEAIALTRRALEIRTNRRSLEHADVANAMSLLADVLNYFNNNDDDVEVPRLYEQSIVIQARVEGSLSVNVAVGENNLAQIYDKRAMRAHAANDMDREMANLELALPHVRESARIYRAIGRVDNADQTAQVVVDIEEELRQVATA